MDSEVIKFLLLAEDYTKVATPSCLHFCPNIAAVFYILPSYSF